MNFKFLGFTHFWGKSRKGHYVVYQKTARGRLAKTLKSFNDSCQRNCGKNRHKPLNEQYAMLNRKLRGHFANFGITGNGKSLKLVHYKVQTIWHKWLGRRSRKSYIPWRQFTQVLKRFPLTPARIQPQYYQGHQLVKLNREEPDALIGLVRVCEGGNILIYSELLAVTKVTKRRQRNI